MPKELRGTDEHYLHEEKVVAIYGLLFNYVMGLFPPDVIADILEKLAKYDLPRMDGNKYGSVESGFSVFHGDTEIKLNYPLGLPEGYAAWRYSKFAHHDHNFLNHAFSACVLRGIQKENDPAFTCREGDFEGGNFYLAKWGILIKLTGIFIYLIKILTLYEVY
jgi:hypothetical protein